MKNKILSLPLIILSLLLSHCEEEKPEPREYPRVNTLPVSNITEEGAVFNADLYSLGTEMITEYGFVWGPYSSQTLLADKIILPGIPAGTGVYSAEIKSTLHEGIKYTVKPYVKTEDHVVYGKPETFVSLGSLAPVITGFEPDTVIWGDTLKIIGKNFSWVPSNNKVRLNQTECSVISSTDTALIVIVNGYLTDINSKISVELAGNSSGFDQKELVLKIPQILKIYPLQVNWGDTVTVSGKFMNTGSNKFFVTVSGFPSKIIDYKKDTILITVPYELVTLSNELEIKINSTDFTTPELLSLIPPVITQVTPHIGYWGDTITVTGDNLNTGRNKFTVTINAIICNIFEYKADTLVLEVPYNLASVTSEVKIKVNNMTLTAPDSLTLMPPYITGIIPKEGTWGTIVTVKGRFHPAKARNNITIGGSSAEIISNNFDSIRVRVNFGVTYHDNPVRNISPPFNVLSPDTFRLFGPYIKSVTPLSGPTGTDIKIRGKYLKYQSGYQTLVHIGLEEVWPLSVCDSVLSGKIPSGLNNGANKVMVTTFHQSSVFDDDFIVKNPVISNISPLTGTYDDELTIEGENFLFSGFTTYVIFNNPWTSIETEIVELSYNKAVAKVPRGIDSIPMNISVSLGFITTTYPQPFVLSPPEITGVSPSTFVAGQDITISGKNFNPETSRNKVEWDIYPFQIKSISPNQIVATSPAILPRGQFKIKLTTGGYVRYSPLELIYTSSQWLRISSPQISTNFPLHYYWPVNNYGKSIKGYGYIASGSMRSMYKFNPLDNTWVQFNTFPVMGGTDVRLMGEVVCKDTFYLISGYWQSYYIAAFDEENSRWNQYSIPNDGPYSTPGVAFSLNDKIYFGLNYYYSSNWFWECDPVNSYKWTRKGDFPGTPPGHFSTYFSLENRGYVVFANNEVWQFNPDSLIWIRKADFPGEARECAISFVLNGFAYMGTGRDEETSSLNDIWKYDHVADIWTLVSNIPVGRYSAVAFSVNNKAYIGFGMVIQDYNPNDLFDFYEFDPNYPLK